MTVALSLGVAVALATAFSVPGRASAQDDEYFIPRRKPAEGVSGQGLYSKPFLYGGAEGKARIGGYFDYEWRNEEGVSPGRQTRFHRLIPFIYGNISDNATFATEIEFEDGGDGGGGEIAVEFAFLDYAISDAITLRAGNILTPLGRLNLNHDSPLLDTVDRPLMHTAIIPTTLSESGFGLLGKAGREGSDLQIGWEVYLTQGFKGGPEAASVITPAKGLRAARGNTKVNGVKSFKDNNSKDALAWRVTVSPGVATQIGLSGHVGTWDDEGRNDYNIIALDLVHQTGPVELLAEWAGVSMDRSAVAEATVPGHMRGYYVQAGYHCYPGFLSKIGGDADAHLTFYARYGAEVIDDPANLSDDNEKARFSYGLSYRPNAAHTVFKLEIQTNDESGGLPETDNDAVLFGVATYF